MINPKLILAPIMALFIVLCGWFAIWPIYEWSVGLRPWFEFFSTEQAFTFFLGLIFFVPSVLFGKKLII